MNGDKMAGQLEEYYRRIPSDDLDKPIDRNHEEEIAQRIADGVEEWKSAITQALELTDSDIADIEKKHQNEPKVQM